ncbi:MAG: gamma-glutamyl-gamma-aminobutyrate hydrolase family protein [Acidobacteria bacterium]|nr:gamma-glutamyl-gamma-aminobutyrate hydrolase family protein [Acidobacteriota bacterium]
MKPIIGITPCSKLDDYVESVTRAGGEPVVLSNDDDVAATLDRVDAILLTGGADVDPALYGQAAHRSTKIDATRDAFEIPLSREAVARNVPAFAICRGVQVLNVAAGGTLVQDIPSASTSGVSHSIQEPKHAPAHAVRVTAGTILASTLPRSAPLDTCPVNSRHHQAVAEVAPSFIVSAVSDDGIIEAIERPASAFCVGVQWHPENFWKTGEFDRLFRAFVDAARERRIRRAEQEPAKRPT